ncbi:two-component system sensor histidine kinase VanS [Nocardioides sp. BE266]|uniref:sensor histidine kinase n=1 Tax=Nocardioides sp. BE266 TaxID=2817725 RepID=UPI0028628B58|nr:HAMP domain-containing sensor histidine kinase [Nocardioides sp. BE266]MDR7254791.1 two-component system sensor histidine kinase VanS [Nocardioides sp. BE266]
MPRPPGVSVRLRLALSYAGVVVVTGVGLLAVVLVFLLRYVPDEAGSTSGANAPDGGFGGTFMPGRSDLWDAFAPKAALMMVLLLVVGLAGGWALAGRMLAPLDRITAATRAAGTGALDHRIRMPGRSDEFRELADAFDGMLERLERHVAEQQRFAANASHELRTPLAITQTLLDVAAKDPSPDVDLLVDRLRTVNTRAIDLTEALLVLSRADQRSFAQEPVDLSLVAEEAAEVLLPLAEERGVVVTTSGDAATASGSRALLLQLATNLLHNAIVHNLPGDGAAWVTTRETPAGAVLRVENTGDHLASDVVATLAEPFRRGTERVHDDHGGVGLGLAIVQRIAAAHDGRLDLAPRTGGGLVALVTLPR